MLDILIDAGELWDEEKQEFILLPYDCHLKLEHSLISVSKWESKWKKPYLTSINSADQKTREQSLDYIRCMSINKVDPNYYLCLTQEQISQITSYINDSMTATIIRNDKKRNTQEILTSETIYYYMITLGIPFECEKWHLNRLLTLINVCSIKSSAGEKMSNREILEQNKKLNALRRKKYSTKG